MRVSTSGSQQQTSILQKTILHSVEDMFNSALHGHAALSAVYGLEHAVGRGD